MRKTFLLSVLTLALAVGGAWAQNAGKPSTSDEADDPVFARPGRMSTEDATAFSEARIAALKAGLQLKADQEKNWPAVETALRDAAKARIANMDEWRDQAPATFESDPIGALQRRAQNMTARAGALEKVAAAAKPLYDTLDEGQKRRFGPLLQAAIRGRMQGMGGMGGMGGGPGGMRHGHGHGHGRRMRGMEDR
jgi:hypothetical protein